MARTVPPCAAPAMTLASAEAAEPAAMSGLFLTETWTLFIAHLCQVVHACAAVGMVTVVQPPSLPTTHSAPEAPGRSPRSGEPARLVMDAPRPSGNVM